jgi:hypothetical protein
MIVSSPGLMSLAINRDIELMDTAVRRCTQALIYCGATGCFVNIEWVWSNNVPTRPITNLISVYNIDGMIVEITDLILRNDS